MGSRILNEFYMTLNIKEKLAALIRGTVEDSSARLAQYGNDASIFEIIPKLVITPEDTADLKTIINFVREHKSADKTLSLTPRAAGTGMSGESLNDSIIVDMKKFNHIQEVGNDYAITEPCVYYRDFEIEVAKNELFLPSYTASKKLCTVGGMVSNNSAGEKTLSCGQTARYVKELSALLADGNEYVFKPLNKEELTAKINQGGFESEIHQRIYAILEKNYDFIQSKKPRVNKNAAGYELWNVWNRDMFDLTQLFAGSQGTLGIITKIKFQLVRPKPYASLLVIFLKDIIHLGDIVNTVLPCNPESFESYDDHTLKLAEEFLPEVTKFFDASIKPKIVLLAEFTGDSEEEAVEKTRCAEKHIPIGKAITTMITCDPKNVDHYCTVRRESFNLLRYHSGHERTAPIIEDIIVRPEFLPEFLPKLYKILDSYNLVYTIAGHIGDGNLHIMPLMDFREAKIRMIAIELCKKVFDLVFEYGGSMSAEHNDGIIRTPFLEHMYGNEMIKLFEEVKLIFDPSNIFNPGKKVFGRDLAFVKEHIDRVY